MNADSTSHETREPASGDDSAELEQRRFARSVLLIACVLVVGGGVAALLIWTRPQAERREVSARVPLVEVLTLVPRDTQQYFVGYGSVRSDHEVVLSAEVRGRVIEIGEGLKDGSPVARDQIVVMLDDEEYRRQLERAEGRLADLEAQLGRLDVERINAQRLVAIAREEVEVTHEEYERLTDLFEKNLASKKEWDFARLANHRSRREWQALANTVDLIAPRRAILSAQRDARRAEKELAALDVERCTIRAPFGGQIGRFEVEQGAHVKAGAPVLSLLDPRHIEIPIELPASVHAGVKIGAACVLTMDSMSGVTWETEVRRISPVADEQSRTFITYLELDNAVQQTPLVPGYFVAASIAGPVFPEALVVPRGAMVGDRVFVVNDDKAHVRTVHVQALLGDRAVISGGVAPGDRVILTNLDVLYEGAPVRCGEETAASTRRRSAGGAEDDG